MTKIFPGVKMINEEAEFERGPIMLWYVMKHEFAENIKTSKGEVHVQLESTFTLQYPKYSTKPDEYADMMLESDTAELEIPSAKSEWSLRLFSSQLGYGSWDKEVVHLVDQKFIEIAEYLYQAGFNAESLSCDDDDKHEE